jgi:leucyl-tRNA synthetase
MMEFVNELFKEEELYRCLWEPFVLILSPYAPHMGEELWAQLGHEPSVSSVEWPTYDEALTVDEEVTVVLQINGKVRSKLSVAAGTSNAELEKLGRADERIAELTRDKTIAKAIVVPDKLVNFVVK